MQNLQEKSLRAIRTLLERKGYEIIDSEWGSEEGKVIGVVAKDDDILVFVDVKEKEFDNDGLDNPDHLSRTELEIEAAKWLSFALTRLIYSFEFTLFLRCSFTSCYSKVLKLPAQSIVFCYK